MTVLATDAFDRGDYANLNELALNWGTAAGGFKIVSLEASPESLPGENTLFWQIGTFPDDQFSRPTIGSITGIVDTSGIGGSVRGNDVDTEYRGYACAAASNNTTIAKVVSGAYTLLAQGTAIWATGDVLEFDVQGSLLTVKQNGTVIVSTTDASITSGSPGITYSSIMTAASIQSWEGGDFSEPAMTISSGFTGSVGTTG